MAKELGLSLLQLGVVISALLFAAAIGALVGGIISDAIGRRKTILILALLFFVGVLLVVFSPAGPEPGTFSPVGFAVLVAGRIVLGLAVGGASTVVPVFLAEMAPYEIRGSITGRNELAIVVGQLSAFVVNAILGVTLGHVDGVWRIDVRGLRAAGRGAVLRHAADAGVAALAGGEGQDTTKRSRC